MSIKTDGILFIFSSPSGAGKTTLVKLVEKKENFFISVSHTTRKPRQNETHNKDYYFVSEDEFKRLIRNEEFLEYAKVHGNWYGTSVEFVQSKLSTGVNLILEIDVQGFRQINDLSLNYDSIFILPPSIDSLEERIKSRGDEDLESINLRLKNAKDELAHAKEYNHIIINDSFEEAEMELFNIISQEKPLNKQNIEEVQQFLAQLLSY